MRSGKNSIGHDGQNEKICKYAHCETDPFGSELCCENGSYCVFNRRDAGIDFSKCPKAVLVVCDEWKKYAAKKGW